MTTSHDSLHAALAAVQADLPAIDKAHTADTGSFSYTYASLNDVNRALLPLLSGHGLTWTCTVQVDPRALVGTLTHAGSGEAIESCWPMPSTTDPQALGSATTYGRRYLLLAVTGSAPDEDDDGAAATHAPAPEPDAEALAAAEDALDELAQAAPDFYAAEVQPKREALVRWGAHGPDHLDRMVSRLVKEQAVWEQTREDDG